METSKFDIADYLASNEMVTECLNAVLADGNESDFIVQLEILQNQSEYLKSQMKQV